MRFEPGRARTLVASGRFHWISALAFLGGCQAAGVDPPEPVAPEIPPVIIAPGPISDAEQDEAQALLNQARASFVANRHLEALRLANEIVEGYPASNASGEALLLSALAEFGAGSPERADAAAERYLSLLPPGDPRATAVRLRQAEFLEGQPLIQLDRLLRITPPASVDEAAQARLLARQAADSLSVEELEIVTGGSPDERSVATPPVYATLAAELLARGEDSRARSFAAAAIDAGANGADLAVAEGVLRGELPDGLRPIRVFEIATVLPMTGPPALAEFAASVGEGVEVAVATVLGPDFTVSIDARDDEADPARAAEIVAQLESEGTPGAIGFLLDEALTTAGAARTDGMPLLSPTARSALQAGPAAYSLESGDPRSARLVAAYAATRALRRVAMVYPETNEATEEADAFAAAMDSIGVPVVGRFTYTPGIIDFEGPLLQAQTALRAAEIAALELTEEDTLHVELLDSVALFMPVPAEDVEFLGQQFSYNGLDTLAIQVMGTSGWTDPESIALVDPRLLEGFVATAPIGAGPDSPGYTRFREAYEEHFRRTLVSGTPAVGYDAALLLLEALRAGRTRPEDVQRALGQLSDVEGAMGVYSIVDGRVMRSTEVVRFEDGELVPISIGQPAGS
jgi:ABC-type branched-subunit amino acid transport system substrate-binding protein